MMNRYISLFFVLLASISCGADSLSKKSESSSSNYSNLPNECRVVSSYMPVCANGKTYENDSYAICDGQTNITLGRCQKTDSYKICLSDDISYGEVEAFEILKSNPNLKIKKYIDCDKVLFD